MQNYFLSTKLKTVTYAAGKGCSYKKYRKYVVTQILCLNYLKEGLAPWCHHHNPTLSLLGALQAPPHLPHPCDQGNCSCGRVAVHCLYVVSSHNYPESLHRIATHSYSKPQILLSFTYLGLRALSSSTLL